MSQENVEIVERVFDAIAREDWAAVQEFLASDAEIHDFDIPDAGVYTGPTAIFDWHARWDAAWDSWDMRDIEIRDTPGERVVALFTMVAKGRGSGVELSRRDAIIWTLQDGQITRIEYFNEHQKGPALEAVGLSE